MEASFDPDMVETVAKAIFTGIWYGGNAEEWGALPDADAFFSKNKMRNGAIDVLTAMRGVGAYV